MTGEYASREVKKRKKREGAMIGMIIIASFLALYNMSAINVAIPVFIKYFNTTVSMVQWTIIGYTLVMGVVSPLAGYLSHVFTLRNYFLTSLAIFTALSFVSGITNSIYVLIIIRAFQGLAGVALIPTSLMVIYQYIPRHRQPFFLTIQNMSLSLGPTLGPVFAGLLLAWASWRWIFWLNVPLGVIALFLAAIALPKEAANLSLRVDIPSFVYALFGCFPILLAFSMSLSWGFFDWRTISLITFGGILVYFFIKRQYLLEEPVLDFKILKNREFAIALFANTLLSMGLVLGPFLFSIYFQMVKGYSAFLFGLILLIPAIFSVGGAPVAQLLYARFPSRQIIFWGWFFLSTGSFILAFVKLETGIVLVIVFLCIRFLGIGLLGMPITDHGMRELERSKTDDGSTLLNWSKLMMSSFTLAVFTLLYELVVAFSLPKAGEIQAMLNGVNVVFFSSGIACVLGWIICLKLKHVSPKS